MAQLDPSFFKPFVEGTSHVLKVQCGLETKAGKPFLKGTKPQPQFDIAGIIGIASSGFSGNITLCFPAAVYLRLMGNMLGETFTALTQELQDGAAELLNMIFGTAKVALNQQGHTIQKAIPSVIRGEALQTSHAGAGQVLVLPFETQAGEFHIEIATEARSLT